MTSGGVAGRAVAWLSDQSLRIAGAVLAGLAGVVTALSVATDRGLAPGDASVAGATATSGGSVTVDVLVAFTLAHPAYPVALALGLVLFALGDDVPLLGD